MFHVLEHIPYQIDTLKILKSKLKKGGKIIIEVPHAEDFLILQEELKEFKNFTFWSEHLILHTYKSLKSILLNLSKSPTLINDSAIFLKSFLDIIISSVLRSCPRIG